MNWLRRSVLLNHIILTTTATAENFLYLTSLTGTTECLRNMTEEWYKNTKTMGTGSADKKAASEASERTNAKLKI